MYCRNCYADLTGAAEPLCPKCGSTFDPDDPGSTLRRPFPSRGRIVGHVIATTVFGVLAAFVVAFHQLARSSGH